MSPPSWGSPGPWTAGRRRPRPPEHAASSAAVARTAVATRVGVVGGDAWGLRVGAGWGWSDDGHAGTRDRLPGVEQVVTGRGRPSRRAGRRGRGRRARARAVDSRSRCRARRRRGAAPRRSGPARSPPRRARRDHSCRAAPRAQDRAQVAGAAAPHRRDVRRSAPRARRKAYTSGRTSAGRRCPRRRTSAARPARSRGRGGAGATGCSPSNGSLGAHVAADRRSASPVRSRFLLVDAVAVQLDQDERAPRRPRPSRCARRCPARVRLVEELDDARAHRRRVMRRGPARRRPSSRRTPSACAGDRDRAEAQRSPRRRCRGCPPSRRRARPGRGPSRP